MIEFKKIVLENFMSLGNVEVDLSADGFTLISGVNNRLEDSAGSNGVGKSSISEGICWALTGETIRGHKDVINRYTTGNCRVRLDFSFRGHIWTIERGMNRSKEKTLVIVKDGQSLESKGYKDSVETLSKELPELTFKFINSVMILGQGLPGRFTNNTPSGRKAVLEELTNADYMIVQVKDRIKNRLGVLSQKIKDIETQVIKNTSDLENQKILLKNLLSKKEELSKFDIEKAKINLEELVNEGTETGDQVAFYKKEVEGLETKLSSLRDQELQIEKDFQSKESGVKSDTLKQIYDNNKEISVLYENKIDELKTGLAKGKEILNSLKLERDHLKTLSEGGKVCPTCGKSLEDLSSEVIRKANEDLEAIEKELGLVQDDINQKEREVTELQVESASRVKEVTEFYQNCEKTLLDNLRSELFKKLNTIAEEKQLLSSDLARDKEVLDNLQSTLTSLRVKYSETKLEIENFEKSFNSISNEIVLAEAKIKGLGELILLLNENLEDLQNRLKIVNQMETFASRDFRGILLEGVISRLDQILKKYAQMVYGNQLTGFYQEGNSIVVEFDGKEYESLSGGEQQKLNILIQLSLRDLIIELTGVSGSLILLDEVFDGLDYQSSEKVVDVFQTLDTSVWIITHHQDLSLPNDRELKVIKSSEGVAHIELV